MICIGSGKQLQCLLDMGNTVTTQCRNMLKQRQQLWGHVSDTEQMKVCINMFDLILDSEC